MFLPSEGQMFLSCASVAPMLASAEPLAPGAVIACELVCVLSVLPAL